MATPVNPDKKAGAPVTENSNFEASSDSEELFDDVPDDGPPDVVNTVVDKASAVEQAAKIVAAEMAKQQDTEIANEATLDVTAEEDFAEAPPPPSPSQILNTPAADTGDMFSGGPIAKAAETAAGHVPAEVPTAPKVEAGNSAGFPFLSGPFDKPDESQAEISTTVTGANLAINTMVQKTGETPLHVSEGQTTGGPGNTVRVNFRRTINTAQYESLTVEMGGECAHNGDMEAAFATLIQTVNTQMTAVIAEKLAKLKGQG